jgi:flavin reductase (DIM6/NTAB) family NADH-FMN oxidoreductase RutF
MVAGPRGVPLLAGCPSRVVCTVLDRLPVGDHTALLVELLDARAGPEPVFRSGMVHAHGIEPGHAP